MTIHLKTKLIIPALLALSVSSLSFADNNAHGKNHGPQSNGNQNASHQSHESKHASGQHVVKKSVASKHKPRPHQDWKRGGYLPRDYRGQGYYVNNWKEAHLREPARGERWVSVNGDYILVSIATNVILDILTGR